MVEEAAVCAKWDEEMGTEVPLGFVRLRKDGSSSSRERAGVIDEIREFVDSRVASYKKLRGGVVVVDEMPKTASGKVLKRVLQERLGVRGRAKL